jgi:hypothetical protein
MAVFLNGKKAASLYLNGKKIASAYLNGKKIYSSHGLPKVAIFAAGRTDSNGPTYTSSVQLCSETGTSSNGQSLDAATYSLTGSTASPNAIIYQEWINDTISAPVSYRNASGTGSNGTATPQFDSAHRWGGDVGIAAAAANNSIMVIGGQIENTTYLLIRNYLGTGSSNSLGFSSVFNSQYSNGASAGKNAVFAGNQSNYFANTYYVTPSGTMSSGTNLTHGRGTFGMATADKMAILAGGTGTPNSWPTENMYADVDYRDSVGTGSTGTNLSLARAIQNGGASAGKNAVFAGGYNYEASSSHLNENGVANSVDYRDSVGTGSTGANLIENCRLMAPASAY